MRRRCARNQNRAVWGSALLAGCIYFAWSVQQSFRASWADLVRIYFGALHEPIETTWAFYAWGGGMLFGLLWVTVGLRGSRGPRDIMGAFWSLAWLALFASALWYGWYVDGYPGVNWWLKGFYIAFCTMAAMHLFLCVRGPGRGAVRLVQQQIAQQAKTFRLGRRRSF